MKSTPKPRTSQTNYLGANYKSSHCRLCSIPMRDLFCTFVSFLQDIFIAHPTTHTHDNKIHWIMAEIYETETPQSTHTNGRNKLKSTTFNFNCRLILGWLKLNLWYATKIRWEMSYDLANYPHWLWIIVKGLTNQPKYQSTDSVPNALQWFYFVLVFNLISNF